MNKSFTHLHFPETNDSPGNLIFQSSIFKCKHVSFREGSWPGSSQGCISQQPKESRPTCCGIWNRNGPRRPAKVAGDHQTHQWPILWQATKKHGNVIFPQPPPKTKKQTSFTKLWPNYFGCQIWYMALWWHPPIDPTAWVSSSEPPHLAWLDAAWPWKAAARHPSGRSRMGRSNVSLRQYSHRETCGALGMVPLIINPKHYTPNIVGVYRVLPFLKGCLGELNRQGTIPSVPPFSLWYSNLHSPYVLSV